MKDINTRQNRILEFLKKNSSKTISEIESFLIGVSRPTINRDLRFLRSIESIYKEGESTATKYSISKGYTITRPYKVEYFYKDYKLREVQSTYNFEVINDLQKVDLFTDEEVVELDKHTKKFQKNYKKIDDYMKNREFERLNIELSWMSSKIEGNTYSVIETEILIENNRASDKRLRSETQMILNHKAALDYIEYYPEKFTNLSEKSVKYLHKILIHDLVKDGIRNTPVAITGTLYKPLSKRKQLKDELKKIIELINNKNSVYEKALLANLLIAYLQPFVDGNKRTARIIGNAILLAYNHTPLSLFTLDENEYKRAVLLFYEQNNISLFKKVFMEQYIFASENYFLT